MRRCYMVRAMDSTEAYFDLFLKNSIVGVGWSEVNFTEYENNPAALRKEVNSKYYSDNKKDPKVIGRKLNEVERFAGIKEGDYIIVPYWSNVLLAVAKSEFKYDQKSKGLDLANQLCVEYRKNAKGEFVKVPRTALSGDLQKRLRVPGSAVSALDYFSDEVVSLFEENKSFENTIYAAMQAEKENSKKALLNVMTNGKNNLKSGGIGLEELVCNLLRCEGYQAKILSKRKFSGSGDADVEATRDDRFSSIKLLFQVKHHEGKSDSWGIEQLIKIKESREYADYDFVFVTSAKATEEARKLADEQDITIIEGEGLAEWIFENVEKLDPELLFKLRISKIPHIVEI